MRQAIDHRQAPVQQELLKYINMIRAEITAKMVPAPVAQSDALSDALTHATAMRRRLHPLGKVLARASQYDQTRAFTARQSTPVKKPWECD
jgi:C4-dicarboxylate-specific signal transduction histidine kinase